MIDAALRKILADTKVIAAVGLSSKPERSSFGACSYLQAHGYRIIPVNPAETEVLGEKAYPDLDSVPGRIDLVQVFRRPEHVPAIVEAAIRKGAKVIWMQDGAGNPKAARRAEVAGLIAVVNDCLPRQHRRLSRL